MSTHLLHLDSSILGSNSVSRSLSAATVARLQKVQPNMHITYRDLVETPIPHLSGAYLAAAHALEAPHDPALQANLALSSAVLDEFLAADVVVIGVAFYNFTIPSQLKAWVDRILVAGKTFRYTAHGVEGLAGGKRIILAISRGGYYGPGSPTHALEHAESYLRGVFAFIGLPQVEVIAAEGIAVGAEQRAAAIVAAEHKIAQLAA